jgi:hypothetical protein
VRLSVYVYVWTTLTYMKKGGIHLKTRAYVSKTKFSVENIKLNESLRVKFQIFSQIRKLKYELFGLEERVLILHNGIDR